MGKNADNTAGSGLKGKITEFVHNFGLPRVIIAGFLLALFILAPVVGADLPTQISNTIKRFSWNAVMVLAMVPMVHAGCGLNFGLPLGIISGLLGATMSIQFGFTGPMSFVMAIVIATPFALILGGGYGWLLNKIKGGEMMIATYGDCRARDFVPPSPWRAFTIRFWPTSCTFRLEISLFRWAAFCSSRCWPS